MEPLSLPNQREPCKVEKIVLVPPDWKIAPKICDFQQSHKFAFQRANRVMSLRLGASRRGGKMCLYRKICQLHWRGS